jgi:hypothetical protein
MTRVLLIDENADHARQLGSELAQRQLTVVREADVVDAVRNLRKSAIVYDFVILIMADRSRPWLRALHGLQQAGQQKGFFELPLFLCVSRLHLACEFQVQIERMGARYVFEESLTTVLEKVHLLIAEIKYLQAVGPHFRVLHRFRTPATDCMPGEEIAAVFLMHRGREYHVRLSLALRILFDFLARHSRVPQSARQIELGIRTDDFYKRHAANATGPTVLTRHIPRSYVKVYIGRLHRAFSLAFQDAGLHVNSDKVLISRKTVGNEIGYQLKASCEWIHIDITSGKCQPLWGAHGRRPKPVPNSAA